MYNQSSFHQASYRGNQQGHDSYLRSDSQQPSQSSSRSAQSQMNNAQKFQPTGYVQARYGQNQNQFQNQSQNQFQNQASNQQFSNAQSFHTANYRGNQSGHDNYLRSDSQSPSNRAAQGMNQSQGYQSQGFQNQGYQSLNQNAAQSFNQSNQNSYANSQPQSYHTASYKGNQQGHDSYLRSDSGQPSQQGFGTNAMSAGANSSFHTASYRGNQQGHDSYLRSDSQSPTQSSSRF